MVGDEIMAANTSHTKEDPLETEINLRIAEQQDEVKKLREENLRVMELAEECQRQLEKINTEAEHQEQETHKYISQVVAQSKERQPRGRLWPIPRRKNTYKPSVISTVTSRIYSNEGTRKPFENEATTT